VCYFLIQFWNIDKISVFQSFYLVAS
jgi:hypothetical protein